jgi:hypothetical protein
MSFMRLVAQGIHNHDINACKELNGSIRHAGAVRNIAKRFALAPEKETEYQIVAMKNRGRRDFDGSKREWPSYLPEINKRSVDAEHFFGSDIIKDTFQSGNGCRASIGRDHAFLDRVETPDIIKAEYVIGMRMGEKQKVHMPDSITQRLLTQIGSGIHDNIRAFGLDINRGS